MFNWPWNSKPPTKEQFGRLMKQLLDDLNKKSGHDQYVASFAARQNPDGTVFSLTYWVDPSDNALMPAADFVAFTRVADGQGHSLGLFEWDRIAAVLGHRMSKTDLYPVRYAVRSFPTAEEVAALGDSTASRW
jgi:hypothetical protein